jgi:membrane protein involved in colicin uptake
MTKEITLPEKVESLVQYTELKSYLISLATKANALTAPDKDIQKELQKARTFLVDTGVLIRSEYRRLADEVMTVQNAHLEIILPVENKLKALKEAEDLKVEIEKRKKSFDERKEKLATIGIELTTATNESLDNKQFDAYFQDELAKKNERERLELEAREEQIRKVEEAQRIESEAKEREEKAREEEKRRADLAIAEANERAEKSAQIERERIEREAKQKADKEKADAEALAKETKYQAFLKEHGYTEETKSDFIVEKVGNKVRLAKILATYTVE